MGLFAENEPDPGDVTDKIKFLPMLLLDAYQCITLLIDIKEMSDPCAGDANASHLIAIYYPSG